MKKKLMLAAAAIVAAASISMYSNSKGVTDKLIDFVEVTIVKVQQAKSLAEIDSIGKDFLNKLDVMEAEAQRSGCKPPTEAQAEAIDNAYMKLGEAVEKAKAKFY